METIKQMIRTPKNHVIRLNIPQHVPENAPVEIIMIVGTPDTDDPDELTAQELDQLDTAENEHRNGETVALADFIRQAGIHVSR